MPGVIQERRDENYSEDHQNVNYQQTATVARGGHVYAVVDSPTVEPTLDLYDKLESAHASIISVVNIDPVLKAICARAAAGYSIIEEAGLVCLLDEDDCLLARAPLDDPIYREMLWANR